MAEPVPEHDMLTTRIAERDLCVCTAVGPTAFAPRRRRAWTAIFGGAGPRTSMLWWTFYDGPTTPGGLQEAHNALVQQVVAGTLPGLDMLAQHDEQERDVRSEQI